MGENINGTIENIIQDESQNEERIPTPEERQKALIYEMKQILRGRYDWNDEVIIAYGNAATQFRHGISDGAWRVALFGISAKSRRYVSVSNPDKYTKQVWDALGNMGRAVFLTEAPELTACLVHSVFCRPGLIIYTMEEKTPVVKVYTGRGFFSFISRRYYMKKLEKNMEGSLIRDREYEKSMKQEEKNNGQKKQETEK